MELKNIKKILIVKPSSLGDIIHTLPFLSSIKSRFPTSELHWVIAKPYKDLLNLNPLINKLWIIDKDTWKKIKNIKDTLSELNILFKNLKKEKFDLVIDLQGLLRSGIITYATNAPMRVGFDKAREGSKVFYTHKVKCPENIHAIIKYLKVAEFLGCDVNKIAFPLKWDNSKSIMKEIPYKNYIVVIPSARWKTKIWPPEKYGKLISLLPLKSIIVGSKEDINIANRILFYSNNNAISLVGKTNLNQLIEIIRNAEFVISNDSGPMHIASALNIPIVAIFGPTNPVKTGPYGKNHIVIKEKVSCSPCRKRSCEDMRCMKLLTVEKVYNTIMERFNL